MKNKLLLVLAVGALALSFVTRAAIIPVGIVNDIHVNDILNDGWSYLYRENYGVTSEISIVFGELQETDWIYLVGIRNSDDMVLAGAAVTWGAFSTYTALNVTHDFNGASWYFNGYSFGFTAIGDTINQNTADTSSYVGGNQGLSIHTNFDSGSHGTFFNIQNHLVLPTYFGSGWSAGSVRALNNSSEYDIAFFVGSNPSAPVPAPASMAMFGLGLGGLFLFRRKFKV
ncbi:PEP-CTERM sorting domain-containing protein [Alkalimonas sp.]|uniref:PEP-CTERM sorting domain-containing protein n=1 Tax=Alkalimonas sp. TaxID=1872453 RepID=UPI00263A5602|nr:PEP-CTERM sorting domain-containing protein [Alkalimonas sp.]MCC5827296.1 PEP-CTERM sorting domain-containing protein [Alkalimonas sp.]